MKKLGILDPRFQLFLAALEVACAIGILHHAMKLRSEFPALAWPALDIKLTPLALLMGLAVGYPIGKKRLRALLELLPGLDAKFYFGERAILGRIPDGKLALRYERLGIAFLAVVWGGGALIAARGQPLSLAAFAWAIVGLLLTARAVPAIRILRTPRSFWAPAKGRARAGDEGALEGPAPKDTEALSTRPVALRGAFHPVTQILLALVLLLISVAIPFSVAGEAWARADTLLAPPLFILGVFAGLPIGARRLRALRNLAPQIDRKFAFTERQVLSSDPQGETAVQAPFLIWAAAFLSFMFIPVVTNGRVVLAASLFAFGLGSHLTGQTVPCIRFWLERRSLA